MSESKKIYTATDAVYREKLANVLDIENEIAELSARKRDTIKSAEKDGCNPKILKQLVRVAKMTQSDREILQDALDVA